MTRPSRLPLAITLAVIALLAHLSFLRPSLADPREQVLFPPPPTSLEAAKLSFDQRAGNVIKANACDRELEYMRLRVEQLNENYDHQGESLTELLIAKVAWLTNGATKKASCVSTLTFDRPKVNGNPQDAVTFEQSILGNWLSDKTPTKCQQDLGRTLTSDSLTIKFEVGPACMKRQINEAILAMVKDSQMGTNNLVCMQRTFYSAKVVFKGDYDVVVRELVRILYLGLFRGETILDQGTVDHMYDKLLAARRGVAGDDYSMVADCDEPAGDEVGSPEDTADRNEGVDLLDALDVLRWPFDTWLKLAVGVVAGGLAWVLFPFELAVSGDIIAHPGFDVRVPETENHRLMIESSKYLTNAHMIHELKRKSHDPDEIAAMEKTNREVKDWLLNALQRIARNDFQEYNARPYTRYSLNAILNLYDFTGVAGSIPDSRDPALCKASRIVLDLTEAKFVAGSNRGRRMASFRRLSQYDGTQPDGAAQSRDLYNSGEGSDHVVNRAMVLAGQTQMLPFGRLISQTGTMVNTAVSRYRLPDTLLELTAERGARHFRPFGQLVRHAGIESYYASRSFTMSVGGVKTPQALDFYTWHGYKPSDRGVAMPTAIIPTITGSSVDDVFRFRGVGATHERTDNLCGWKGFICGVNAHLPDRFGDCFWLAAPPLTRFINSKSCIGGEGPHFFLAAKVETCPRHICGEANWGIMEVIDAPLLDDAGVDEKFRQFTNDRQAAFNASGLSSEGFGTYVTHAGETIAYTITQELPHVRTVNGQAVTPTHANQSFLSSGLINVDGQGGFEIKHPWRPGAGDIKLNFTRAHEPQVEDPTCELQPSVR